MLHPNLQEQNHWGGWAVDGHWKRRVAIAIFADVSPLATALDNLVRELNVSSEIVVLSGNDNIDALLPRSAQAPGTSSVEHSVAFLTVREGKPHVLPAGQSGDHLKTLGAVVSELPEWLAQPVSASLMQQVASGASVLFVSVESAIAEATVFRMLLRSCVGKIQLHDLPD